MGVVFRAHDPSIERHVAIKVIHANAYSSSEEADELRMRLVREARAAGKLSHPGIVTVNQLDEHDDSVYIVMEFVEGQSLAQLAAAGKGSTPPEAIAILRQIAEALDYAHGNGIVHRDIKPANVLIGRGERVKIADFGIAKIRSQNVTRSGVTVGTPLYMSPEQINAAVLDGRADQYSLAVVAFEMLTGRKPFEAPTYDALILKIVTSAAPPAHEIKASVPSACSKVLAKALSKSPEERYDTCVEFVDALEASFAAPVLEVGPVRRRRPLIPIMIALALVVAAGAGLWWWLTPPARARDSQTSAGRREARRTEAGITSAVGN